MSEKMLSGRLTLKTGEVFNGFIPRWYSGTTFGETVFNTGMVGYTEILTDPSYEGQIVCFTYPSIGNYGVEDKNHWESDRISVSGVVVSELSHYHDRVQSRSSFENFCKVHKVPIISGIDTRFLTKVLRVKGVVSGAIVAGESNPIS